MWCPCNISGGVEGKDTLQQMTLTTRSLPSALTRLSEQGHALARNRATRNGVHYGTKEDVLCVAIATDFARWHCFPSLDMICPPVREVSCCKRLYAASI